ncbi:MAG: hypothetical protein WBE95_10820 [Trebonia sp.]|uniref:hypothetical protein n=1 Tax=Trebonia sp. TaxID=2767075 RepID=UPI003C77B0A3
MTAALAVQVFDWGLVIEMTTEPGAGVAAAPEFAAALAGAAVDAGEATVPLAASAVAVPPVPGEAATTTPRQAVSEISDASGTATAATLVIEQRMGGSPSREAL